MYAGDRAKSEGGYLGLRVFGTKWGQALFIPFGNNGDGWLTLMKLMVERHSVAMQITNVPIRGKNEIQQLWEDEILVVARTQSSRLAWEQTGNALELDLFPFNKIKVVAPVGLQETKKAWLKKRLETIQEEKVYFNGWRPLCNRVS